MEKSIWEEVCLNIIHIEKLKSNKEISLQRKIDIACLSKHFTTKKQHQMPIADRTESFNYVLYEIHERVPKIKLCILLLIFF